MTILRSMFTNNFAVGGQGADGIMGYYGDPGMNGGDGSAAGSGGAGNGGAIYNAGTLQVINTTFAANLGAGANGGAGGAAGGAAAGYGTSGGSGGSGGAGGTGTGALFNSGSVQLVNCTFALNSGSGGTEARAGPGAAEPSRRRRGSGRSDGSGFGAISGVSPHGRVKLHLWLGSGSAWYRGSRRQRWHRLLPAWQSWRFRVGRY